MPSLPWVRTDSNIASHDKILALIDDPSPKKWQALSVYLMSYPWSGGHGTDGKIPKSALKQIHGTPITARLLVKYRLWTEELAGWEIVDSADRQQLSDETYSIRKQKHMGGIKGNCKRWHEAGCECWKDAT